MERVYHVSPVENRDSIRKHGLDSARMSAARGAARSPVPEAEGCFLCESASQAEFFAGLHGGHMDIWAVDVSGLDIVESSEGFLYHPNPIPPERLALSGTLKNGVWA